MTAKDKTSVGSHVLNIEIRKSGHGLAQALVQSPSGKWFPLLTLPAAAYEANAEVQVQAMKLAKTVARQMFNLAADLSEAEQREVIEG